MDSLLTTTLKYILFAIISSGVNLLLQAIVFHVYDGTFVLHIALFVGTAGGLLVKYILDKKHIFYYETKSKYHEMKKFFLYTNMGIITTAIFWISEYLFYYLFQSPYLGGALGLAIGYSAKYKLDKRFVFVD